MASVNKVIIVGNLGHDPSMRYSPEGVAQCSLSIATTSQWKDKSSGERREETEWHRVIIYSRLAEIAGEYLKKGRSVYIEGRLRTRNWKERGTNADRYTTEVIADQMQMLGGAPGDRENAPRRGPAAESQATRASGGTNPDDDIPFGPRAAGRAWACA
jgi:single-strand DNA-binding protein